MPFLKCIICGKKYWEVIDLKPHICASCIEKMKPKPENNYESKNVGVG